ncbi:MAG: menaquinone biosynthesis decarboxylase [Bacteroidales bacterium]
MAFKSLSHFIQSLEENHELVRIREFVSPNLEITEIADRMVKNGGRALLFENTGTQFPLLINGFASDKRICLALGINNLTDIEENLARLMKDILGPRASFVDKLKLLPTLGEVASWMPKSVSRRGACQEVVMENPDLTKLPVLTCWPADGGPFITLPGVHTKDPHSGLRNLGMYRMQVFSPTMTGMHWHLHKGSARHYHQYKEMGKRMPVSVTLGGDPVYTYAATAPLPENLDEYLLAGFLRKQKVELVKCLTNDLEVPADVDFVIEGYVDPAEELILEGPFGDHTGYYSLADYFPRFHVTCITHRKSAIYPTTIVGIPPQEDGWIGKATERIFLMPIRMTVAPEITDIHMPVEGVFHNITLVSIRKEYPGQAPKIMSSLWGAGQMMFNKIMVVADPEVKLTDYPALARSIAANVDPVTDIHFLRGPVDILDHASSKYAYGSKMGIDATTKLPQELSDIPHAPSSSPKEWIGKSALQEIFPEIRDIRSDLPGQGISLVIIAVKKSKKHHVRLLAASLLEKELLPSIKFVLFVDDVLDLESFSQLVWISANNIDPVRDCFYVDRSPGVKFPVLNIDATRKSLELDNFQRDWPNVIVMDEQTIRTIDEKWSQLGIGPHIGSPSIRYKSLVISSGAVSVDNFPENIAK